MSITIYLWEPSIIQFLFFAFVYLFVCLHTNLQLFSRVRGKSDFEDCYSLCSVFFVFVYLFVFLHTKPQLLSRVWGKSESKDCHGGDEEARHNQVGEVVQGSPPDVKE